MKAILFLSLLFLVSCVDPTKIGHQDDPKAPGQPSSPDIPYGPNHPIYVPPHYDGATPNVLRPPHGYASASIFRGAMAQNDPMYGACTEPGTIYMFFDNGALVQYIPDSGTYTILSLAFKGDVERHNYQYPNAQWDVVTVSVPGLVHDLSHDPPYKVLTIRFLTNAGTFAEHPNVSGYVFDNTFSLEDYHTFVNPDGSPKAIIRGDFEGWGASDGHTVIHMQLGGDGASIPPMTYHF